ncbi:hypothetical protein Tco_0482151, partial [Tanacetum coccineum]
DNGNPVDDLVDETRKKVEADTHGLVPQRQRHSTKTIPGIGWWDLASLPTHGFGTKVPLDKFFHFPIKFTLDLPQGKVPSFSFHEDSSSTLKLFKTTSFDHPSSSEFELFSNYEEKVEEEITETMMEPTMKEYMTKIREDYGSSIARPKFDEKAKFELKGQFLKELRDNTFGGSDNEYANEHIKRVLEIVNLFTTPDVTQDQLMVHVFPISPLELQVDENVIVARADNRPSMLNNTNYSSWASRMMLYIKGKEHGKLLVDSVLNGPFQYGTIVEPRNENTPATVRARTYNDLKDEEKIRESVDMKATRDN